MLRNRSRLHLERLEAREVPAAISSLVAPPTIVVSIAPVVPVATPTFPLSNAVVIGISLADPTLMAPSDPTSPPTGIGQPSPTPYQYWRYDPNMYLFMSNPIT